MNSPGRIARVAGMLYLVVFSLGSSLSSSFARVSLCPGMPLQRSAISWLLNRCSVSLS